MELNMKARTDKMLKELLKSEGRRMVKELSDKYGFSLEEGLMHLRLDSLEVKKVLNKETSKIPIPFCGKKLEGCCDGIRLNHGLYTQCKNDSNLECSGKYSLCKTCINQKEKNTNGEPTYGCIDNRIKLGKDFRDPKGKAPINYGNIMEKLNISRNEAEREAANQNQIIPEEEFEVKKKQRGRPKKSTMANDTSGSEEDTNVNETKTKKCRGRPKKEEKAVTKSGEELIKSMIKESQKEETCAVVSNDSETDVDNNSDEEDELSVEEVKIKGKKYLKAADNTLYDIKTHEQIGTLNPTTSEITLTEDDDEDED